ncbi:Oxoglutarate/iron-dependent dioxygenase, partial [Trema orientale]
MFDDGTQGLRMNFYPPCVLANKFMGLTPHSDATGLTLLVQMNNVKGLQIRKNGKWVPVNPIPSAFIINIGNIIEHRAVVNPEKQRLSIGAFHGPHIKAMICPLPDLVKETKVNYKTISHEDYIRLLLKSKLDGKSQI